VQQCVALVPVHLAKCQNRLCHFQVQA
jgi:hypothetical protein